MSAQEQKCDDCRRAREHHTKRFAAPGITRRSQADSSDKHEQRSQRESGAPELHGAEYCESIIARVSEEGSFAPARAKCQVTTHSLVRSQHRAQISKSVKPSHPTQVPLARISSLQVAPGIEPSLPPRPAAMNAGTIFLRQPSIRIPRCPSSCPCCRIRCR